MAKEKEKGGNTRRSIVLPIDYPEENTKKENLKETFSHTRSRHGGEETFTQHKRNIEKLSEIGNSEIGCRNAGPTSNDPTVVGRGQITT